MRWLRAMTVATGSKRSPGYARESRLSKAAWLDNRGIVLSSGALRGAVFICGKVLTSGNGYFTIGVRAPCPITSNLKRDNTMDRDTVERMETQVARVLGTACDEQLAFALLAAARANVKTYQQWRPLPVNTTPEQHDIMTRVMVCIAVAEALNAGAAHAMANCAEADAKVEASRVIDAASR